MSDYGADTECSGPEPPQAECLTGGKDVVVPGETDEMLISADDLDGRVVGHYLDRSQRHPHRGRQTQPPVTVLQRAPDLRNISRQSYDYPMINRLEPGHWVTESMGHLDRLSRPGHRVIIMTQCETRVFPIFEKKIKIYIFCENPSNRH